MGMTTKGDDPLKIGVRAHDFGKKSPDHLASVIKKAGFVTTQLAIIKAIDGVASYDDIDENVIDFIREGFAQHSLGIALLGCYIEPSLLDDEQRLQNVATFQKNLHFANLLNVPFVGTETTHFSIHGSHDEREKAYAKLKDSVLRICETAEKENVSLAIEPVADHTLYSADYAKRLIDEVGSTKLKIIMDPVNLILSHTEKDQIEIYQHFLDVLGNYIEIFHIKDIVFDGEEKVWRLIGQGIVDFSPLVTWLKQSKKCFPLLREHVHPDCATEDVNRMKKLFL